MHCLREGKGIYLIKRMEHQFDVAMNALKKTKPELLRLLKKEVHSQKHLGEKWCENIYFIKWYRCEHEGTWYW